MKKFIRRMASALVLCLVVALALPAFAQAADYTYTVTLSAGRLGDIQKGGITVAGSEVDGVKIDYDYDNDKVTITGLRPNHQVTLDARRSVPATTDDRYYVQGIRLSGRDNKNDDGQSEGAMYDSSFTVTGDADYVVAYGIAKDLVKYTVRYVDTDGNALHADEEYYGNVGDHPVIAYLYFDGYTPDVYNITATLSADESQNVFTFVYSRISSGDSGSGSGSGDGDGTSPTPTPGPDGTTVAPTPVPTPGDIIVEIPVVVPGTTTGGGSNGGGSGGGSGSGSGTGNDNDADSDADSDAAEPEETAEPEEVVVEVPAEDTTGGDAANGNGNGNGGDAALTDGTGEGEGLDEETIGDDDTPLGRLMQQIKKAAEAVANASPVAKVGLAVGVAAAVGLLIFLILFLRRKKKKDEEQ